MTTILPDITTKLVARSLYSENMLFFKTTCSDGNVFYVGLEEVPSRQRNQREVIVYTGENLPEMINRHVISSDIREAFTHGVTGNDLMDAIMLHLDGEQPYLFNDKNHYKVFYVEWSKSSTENLLRFSGLW